jgi:rhamnosyl/mannosyltransferase
MRVLELGKYYPPHRGGMETHLKTLCDALKDRIELTALVASDQARTTRSVVDGVPVIRAGTIGCVASAPVCPSLPYLARRIRADLVHIHAPNPAAVLAYLAACRGTPLVVTYQSDTVRQRFLGKAFEPILDRALRRAAIVCTSPQYRDSSPLLQRHRERCHVIPLAIDSPPLTEAGLEAAARIRARYGPRILLAAGRLVYYKGFEHLIRAMRSVAGRLLLAGRGPLRASLERAARENGVAGRVAFLGEVEDFAPYYEAADVVVLPSIARSEAFGIVQLEAMARERPVVNTWLDSGVPFVSLHGVTGLTVPPADSAALAGAINLLLDRPDLRKSFGAAGRRRVGTHFTVKAMADATLDVFEKVLGRRRADPPVAREPVAI